MKITIEPTERVLDDVAFGKARVWNGVSEKGVKCLVLVSLVRVDAREDNTDFERELAEQLPPARFIDLRMLL